MILFVLLDFSGTIGSIRNIYKYKRYVMNSLATRIKERMKVLGMTQEMLANKMGITRGAVTHYLAARRTPPLSQFKKLAAILKVEPAWLHYGTVTAPTKAAKEK